MTMKERCNDLWQGVIALAEGREDEAASRHIEGCPACTRKLDELKQMFALGDLRFFEPPASLVADVKAMMPAQPRRVASLLRSTLAWTGARVVAEDFQIVVGDEGAQTRLMYSRIGSDWQIMGKLPSAGWSVEKQGVTLEDGGRFSFTVPSLAETGFVLAGPDGEIEVPPAEELLRGSREPS
jgi:hypothetical protein